MNEPSKLLCKKCKHSFVPIENRIMSFFAFGSLSKFSYYCKKTYKPKSVEHNPVTGPVKIPEKYEPCASARMRTGECGADATLWEPKHKKDLFLMLTEK